MEVKKLFQILFIVAIALLLYSGIAYASYYYGHFTGYAMQNQYGSNGIEVRQGHFANHWYEICPNDPAAWWLFGTQISTPQVIHMHNQSGGTTSWSTFILEDLGDFNCSEENYWVDIYFGRYKPSDDNCLCDGVWGYCYTGIANSCTDASVFGTSHYFTYWGPPH